MSFGKNPEQLGRVVPYGGNLSQRARHLAHARQNRGSGGGAAPYWKDTLKVPQDHARFGRLIPGAYVQPVSFDGKTVEQVTYEYVMFKEHFMGGRVNRGGICSSGPLFSSRQHRDPCHGCDIFWEDVEVRKAKKQSGDKTKGPNRISLRDMYAFTWWDYGAWYHAPRKDGQGRIVTDQNGAPRLDWVMGQENDSRYSGCEWKYGHLLAWPMGETYRDTLLSANDYIMQDCANCGGRGVIQFVSKNCAGCGATVYDAATSLTPEQRTQVDNSPHQCQCGHNGFLTEMINCGSCGNGKRASVFDVDLQITAVGSKGQQTFLQILNRSEPRPIQVQDPEVLKGIQPLDLIQKFSPTPLDKQAEWWGTGEQRQPAPQAPPPAPQMQQPVAPQMVPQAAPQMVQQPPQPAAVQYAPQPQAAQAQPQQGPPRMGSGGMPGLPGMQPAPGFAPPTPSLPGLPGFARPPAAPQGDNNE